MLKLVLKTCDVRRCGSIGIEFPPDGCRALLLRRSGENNGVSLLHLQHEVSRNHQILLAVKAATVLIRICHAHVPVRMMLISDRRSACLDEEIREGSVQAEGSAALDRCGGRIRYRIAVGKGMSVSESEERLHDKSHR